MNHPAYFRPATLIQSLPTRQIVSILGTAGLTLIIVISGLPAQDLQRVDKVELQPLAAQVARVVEALDYLGAPVSSGDKDKLRRSANEYDMAKAGGEIQRTLDKYSLSYGASNPES